MDNFPSVAEITKLSERLGFKKISEAKPQIIEDDCQWCDGFGIVAMSPADSSRLAPFHCTYCENGEAMRILTSTMSDGSIASARQGWCIGWRPQNKLLLARCLEAVEAKKVNRLPYRDDPHY